MTIIVTIIVIIVIYTHTYPKATAIKVQVLKNFFMSNVSYKFEVNWKSEKEILAIKVYQIKEPSKKEALQIRYREYRNLSSTLLTL